MVKEIRQGVKGTMYLLIVPLVLILGIGGYFGYEVYKDYKSYLYNKNEHEQKVLRFEKELKNITPDLFIRVEKINDHESDKKYIKIEKINKETVLATTFSLNGYDITPVGINQNYTASYETYNRILIKKSDLLNAFTKDYDQYNNNKKNSAKLLGDGIGYQIVEIFKQYAPIIERTNGISINGDYLSMSFDNCGWYGKLITIKNITGNIKWDISLPIEIKGVEGKQYGCSSFSISGTNYERNIPYKFEMTIEDSLGNNHKYQVEGINFNRTITKID